MTLTRLEQWQEQGVISAEQASALEGRVRERPFSVFLELNILLYAGVLAFVGGLAWTVGEWSAQLGDLLVLAVLSGLFAACLWYCFTRAVGSRSLVFDYVLYLGALTWSVELVFVEKRFHLLSGQWDWYLLATAGLFFVLAYRFDNRFVLSMALSALAGWFGLTISHWPGHQDSNYRMYAIVYSLVVASGGLVSARAGIKAHFRASYLNLSANVLFLALLSGVFGEEGRWVWFAGLLGACAASVGWGLPRREFSFVAYAAVYGYVGTSSMVLRGWNDGTGKLAYFTSTGGAMVVLLIVIARRFGREA